MEDEYEPRAAGCQCHLEIGDSPCLVHGMDEAPDLLEDQIAAFYALEGDFFDACDNPESLTHQSAVEALEEAFDDWGEGVAIRVDAWNRREVPEEWKVAEAYRMIDGLIESFDDPDEGFGSLDEGTMLSDGTPRSDALRAELVAKAREVVDLFLGRFPVCRCEKVGEVELSPEAVKVILEREEG